MEIDLETWNHQARLLAELLRDGCDILQIDMLRSGFRDITCADWKECDADWMLGGLAFG